MGKNKKTRAELLIEKKNKKRKEEENEEEATGNRKWVQDFIINNFSERTQRLAILAVDNLRDDGYSWRWIKTAFLKKSASNWEEWGFGLMFNRNFHGSVNSQIKRENAVLGKEPIKELLNKIE